MFCRLLSSLLLVVITAVHSRAQDDPPSCSWKPDFHPVNNIQIGGCSDTAAIDELRILTRTILDLLQNQDICCTPTPDPDIDECLSNPCQNGGTCTDLISEYQCVCSPGYTGTECALDIDECMSNPCQNGGTCTDLINGYQCVCSPGYAGTECASVPRDCAEIQAGGMNVSGVYTIYPEGADVPLFVYCDMDTDGGGWTVFQRRQDGTVDFYVDWNCYKYGFGSVTSEFWLGNDNIHLLSTQKQSELRIDLEDFDGQTRYATYSYFFLTDETRKYILTIGDYSGDAGDSLSYHYGSPFSTKDQDNDADDRHCAVSATGAWWYKSCVECNLNGQYLSGVTGTWTGVFWYHWLGNKYSLKKTEMKFRPV